MEKLDLNISKQPLRVLHFLADLNVASGVTNVLMNYYRNIDRNKVQFDFLYFEEAEVNCAEEIETLGGRHFKIEKPHMSRISIQCLSNFFKEHQGEWNAIHCHPVYASVIIGSIAKKNGIKYVIQHSHSNKFGDTKKSSLRNYLISRLNPLIVDYYFSCTEEAKKLLGWKIFLKNKTKIIHNAIDCDRFKFDQFSRENIRKKYHISTNTVVLGHSGRFSPEKNHSYLLDVFYEYNLLNQDSVLMLLGDGIEKENIQRKINDYKLNDKVIILGRKDDPEKYLNAMDIFVFPSYFEGLSLALVEAQCNGLICYVSENIDSNSKLTNEFYEFSLSLSAKEVAKMLPDKIRQIDRNHSFTIISNSNLNLINEVKKLEAFYANLY